MTPSGLKQIRAIVDVQETAINSIFDISLTNTICFKNHKKQNRKNLH